MEVLYCIITILIIIMIIILMLTLFFRNKKSNHNNNTNKCNQTGINIIDLKHPVKSVVRTVIPEKHGANYDYEVHYKGQKKMERDYGDADTYNQSIDDRTINEIPTFPEPVAALNLTVTSDRHSAVKTCAQIWEDDLDENGKSKLDREGVLFGRNMSNSDSSICDYWMRTLQMSRTGSFGVRRKGDGFVIFGIKKKDRSGNDKSTVVREEMYGEQKKCIYFKEKGTCYVGDIRFDFEVPHIRDQSVDDNVQIVGYYDEATDDSIADDITHVYP